ncbi:cytochrome b5-like Heme/Steroid binding domain protein, partial [Ostertagia ostertagi]
MKKGELGELTSRDLKENFEKAFFVGRWLADQGVYDITEFHKLHPGGDKILLAAGGAVDPYWSLYAQHKTAEVMEILEEYRIGNLDPKDVEATKTVDASNPFSKDPERHPALVVNQQQPFNAETPAELNCGSFSHSKRVILCSTSPASSRGYFLSREYI